MASEEAEAKLGRFLQWLQVNNVELRGCKIKYCGENKGFGIFSSNHVSDGVLLVVPLDIAITPMRVLQDPLLGPECRAMFEEGEVDDRFLMILFLTVERLRKNSSWKPYFDMLPTTFGNPLWFTEDELLELKGTTLYRATELQKQKLLSLYDGKVKGLVKKLLILDGDSESEVTFEDFLWANSIFWTRALNIPLPRSYVFPQIQEDQDNCGSVNKSSEVFANQSQENGQDRNGDGFLILEGEAQRVDIQVNGTTSTSLQTETLWVEGLVPGIDFCNHDLKAAATWEVDGTGLVTGVPFSMYLLSVGECSLIRDEEEISISYGNKGNEWLDWLLLVESNVLKIERGGCLKAHLVCLAADGALTRPPWTMKELLYLYGFVIDDNTDDYLMIANLFRDIIDDNTDDCLMVHYPVEAIQSIPYSDSKAALLEAQRAELRCLLPKSLLDHGFFPPHPPIECNDKCKTGSICDFSWSGQRRMPSYLNKLVFPENFLAALRTIAMRVDEHLKVSSLLEELVGSGGERQPSDAEVKAAVWEACGDSGALQLLVDLLHAKLMDLEENSGTEDCDSELLGKTSTERLGQHACNENNSSKETNGRTQHKSMSKKRWSSIVYRRGQKELTRLFLREAEHALQLALSEGS
ncbi:hypothetical protein JRO89_XS01G0306300 [Xanthoceras sorbifolium]|uniref:SET domain-containing protein n=1 Tax=Xanthoceras sorbifolium TaxID=99658 RepID=A0ABQ8IMV1_9ROSI|nr:hypothetical protein JRO89_XS01G0306300 [Xanthoceras sorbifolium]